MANNAPEAGKMDSSRISTLCECGLHGTCPGCGCGCHPTPAVVSRCLARTREGLEGAFKPHDKGNHLWFDPDSPAPEGVPLDYYEPIPAVVSRETSELESTLRSAVELLEMVIKNDYIHEYFKTACKSVVIAARRALSPSASKGDTE